MSSTGRNGGAYPQNIPEASPAPPWHASAYRWAQRAVRTIRRMREVPSPEPRPKGRPNQPETLYFEIAIEEIMKEEGVSSRTAAARMLVLYLVKSPLSDEDRTVLDIPRRGATKLDIDRRADSLRRGPRRETML